MKRARRAALATLLALLVLGVGGASVAAHALLQASDPAANAVLPTAPAAITLVFTERPDPALSFVRVLDASGKEQAAGSAANGPGGDKTLTVGLEALPSGVYTVIWRTVSIDDGHASTGSFAFSVGTGAPPPSAASGISTPEASGASAVSLASALSRALFFLGALLLLGLLVPGELLLGARGRRLGSARLAAWLLAVIGSIAVFVAQAGDAGVAPGEAIGSSLGVDLMVRLIPILGAGGLILIGDRAPARRRVSNLGAAALVGLAILGDSTATHAAAAIAPILNIGLQTLHALGAAVWLGGLAGVLLALRRSDFEARGQLAAQFSRWATVGIVIVGLTGVARGAFDLQRLDQLTTTDYGRLLLAKAAVFAGLAALGALNHFRSVPAGDSGVRSLQRLGVFELALGTVAVLVAALLVTTPPPATAAANAGLGRTPSAAPSPTPAPTPQVTANGADYATTIRVRLTVTPGAPGPGEFAAAVTNFDSGAAVEASGVKLRFALPSRPDVSASSLTLTRMADGTFGGSGSNLSLTGFWTVTAVVTMAGRTVEVPMAVPVAPVVPPVSVIRLPVQPASYTVDLGAKNTVQLYLDTSVSTSPATLHVTLFDARGKERPVTDIAVQAAGPDGQPTTLPMSDIEPGHATAKLDVTPGAPPTELLVTGIDPDDTPITFSIAIGADN